MPENELKMVFSKNLNYYLSLSGENQVEVAKKLGISTSTFSSWCTGQKMPRMDKIEMLANYFGIEKSDLIEDSIDKSKSNQAFFRLKKGLEPYNIDSDDADFILDVFKAHKKRNED
ncbi:MAG: helix-turn-helix transcriptional regulator [Candidatus Pseudoruminococcus sp.]|nr:helix-turn-helix domain-containing protein [Ruminococcus sp.]MDY2783294.1 helix-turn-helix transcriptional regulator [Candidatus Pseudoruminococcus sp.]